MQNKEDYLNREETVKSIVSLIESSMKNCHSVSFSINGEWGVGKTWLIEKITNVFNGNDNDVHSETACLVINYNCWEKDYYTEPLIAILITIINQLNEYLYDERIIESSIREICEKGKEILQESASAISKRLLGIDVIKIGKDIKKIANEISENAVIKPSTESDEINVEIDIKIVVKELNEISKSIPILFIVDELDRCMPEHAIKTLERMHHLLGKVNNSVTVVSVNEKQLKNTVNIMFGKNISFEQYMKKFVDFNVELDYGISNFDVLKQKLESFFALFEKPGNDKLQNEIISKICDVMTARDFEKLCDNAMLCHNLTQLDSKKFTKDCATAELLLWAYKIALEKESNIFNLLPTNGNTPETAFGKYIKSFLKKCTDRKQVDLSEADVYISSICGFVLGYGEKINLGAISQDSLISFECIDYYKEYAKYYKLIK